MVHICMLSDEWLVRCSTRVALTLIFEVIPRTGRNYEREKRKLYTPRHNCWGYNNKNEKSTSDTPKIRLDSCAIRKDGIVHWAKKG